MNARLRRLGPVKGSLWVLTGLTIAVWCWQIWSRGRFALDLEWMESGALHQAYRIGLGRSAYPEPNSEFVPHLYTPGYSYVLALLGKLFPLDFGLARSVSLLSVVASAWAILKIVDREGRPLLSGWVAVAIFLSSFRFCYRWMDLARADSLMLALVLWGLYFLRSGWGHTRNVVLAGVLMSAAYWTKQSAFTIIVGSGVAALWVAPRLVWLYVLIIGCLGGIGTWIYNQLSDGWFWYYIFELHQSHRFNAVRLRQKSWLMILHTWPLAMAMLGGWMWRVTSPWLKAQRKLDRTMERLALARQSAYSGPIFWWIMLATTAAAGAVSYSTQWAEPNAFLPFCATLGATIGVVMSHQDKGSLVDRVLIAGQFAMLLVVEPNYAPVQKKGWGGLTQSYPLWQPMLGQPDQKQVDQAQALADRWDQLSMGEGILDRWGTRHQGSLLALQHPWWSVRVGGAEHVASMALNDLGPEAGAPVRKALQERIKDQEFAAIWVEGRAPRWLSDAMGSNYALQERRWGSKRVRPMSGWMSKAGTASQYRRHQRLYLATRAVAVDSGCRRLADFEDATAQGLEVTRGSLNRGPVPRRARDPIEYEGGAGQYAWQSVTRRQGVSSQGSARIELPQEPSWSSVSLGVAYVGEPEGLTLRVVSPRGEVAIPLPKRSGVMERVQVEVISGIQERGPQVAYPWTLEIEDASDKGVLIIDELWVCEH